MMGIGEERKMVACLERSEDEMMSFGLACVAFGGR